MECLIAGTEWKELARAAQSDGGKICIWNWEQHDCIAKPKLTREEEKSGRIGLGQWCWVTIVEINKIPLSYLLCRTSFFCRNTLKRSGLRIFHNVDL